MKKIAVTIMTLVLILSLSACNLFEANQPISLKTFISILTKADYTVSEESIDLPDNSTEVSPVVYVNGDKTLCFIEFESESDSKQFFESTVSALEDMPVYRTSRKTTIRDAKAFQMDTASSYYVVISTGPMIIYGSAPIDEKDSMIEDVKALGY